MELANAKQRAQNRPYWRMDLRQAGPEESRCALDRMRDCYAGPSPAPVRQCYAGARAVQLLSENPGMVNPEHPELAGAPPVGWMPTETRQENRTAEYPRYTPALPMLNQSAQSGFYDLIQQVYNVNHTTMRQIAEMIPA